VPGERFCGLAAHPRGQDIPLLFRGDLEREGAPKGSHWEKKEREVERD
jgi:hypothetical protein